MASPNVEEIDEETRRHTLHLQNIAAECIQRFWRCHAKRECSRESGGARTQEPVAVRMRVERAERVRKELSKLDQLEVQRERQRSDWNKRQMQNAKQKVAELIQARKGRANSSDNAARRKAIFEAMVADEELLHRAQQRLAQ